MKALIIDDEATMTGHLAARLPQHGFAADTAPDGATGIRLARTNEYDIILLDLQLPDMRGSDVIAELRKLHTMPPVLLVSVIADAWSKVELLNAGADDYLPKPFLLEELVARMRALLRRRDEHATSVLIAADLTLDPYAQTAWRAGEALPLTRKEFDILEYLLRHQDRIVPKSELIEHVWDSAADPFSASIDTHLGNLRRKLGLPEIIETIHGRGCRIKGQQK